MKITDLFVLFFIKIKIYLPDAVNQPGRYFHRMLSILLLLLKHMCKNMSMNSCKNMNSILLDNTSAGLSSLRRMYYSYYFSFP